MQLFANTFFAFRFAIYVKEAKNSFAFFGIEPSRWRIWIANRRFPLIGHEKGENSRL